MKRKLSALLVATMVLGATPVFAEDLTTTQEGIKTEVSIVVDEEGNASLASIPEDNSIASNVGTNWYGIHLFVGTGIQVTSNPNNPADVELRLTEAGDASAITSNTVTIAPGKTNFVGSLSGLDEAYALQARSNTPGTYNFDIVVY